MSFTTSMYAETIVVPKTIVRTSLRRHRDTIPCQDEKRNTSAGARRDEEFRNSIPCTRD